MALYTDTVMDHFLHPRNVGEIADADGVGVVFYGCGADLQIFEQIHLIPIQIIRNITICCTAERTLHCRALGHGQRRSGHAA